MLPKFNQSQELLEEVQKERLYPALLQQLKKDFQRSNVPLDLKGDLHPMELRKLLHEKIYQLILERFHDYLNLLYMVDIPEQLILGIEASDPVDLSEKVSFLLLKREAQKVWYKSKFSG